MQRYYYFTPMILLVTAAAVSILLTYTAWRRRPAPGAISFAILMSAVAEWSLTYAFELGSVELHTKMIWANISFLGIVILPTAWVFFALKYTRRDLWLTPFKKALFAVIPLITLFLVWTNGLHGLIWGNVGLNTSGYIPMRISTHGVWYWVNTLYSYLLVLIGAILIIEALTRSPHLYKGQTAGLLIGVFIPWIGNALYNFGLSPFPNLDLTPFAFTLTGFSMAWSVFGFRLFDIVPVAREAVIESMPDVVIVLDTQDRIVDLNPAAQQIIGCKASEAIGKPTGNVLSDWPDLSERCRKITGGHSEIVLGENGKRRYFDLSISPLHDKHNYPMGRLMVLRDITERKEAEEVLKKNHDELERRVEERTAELKITNEKLKKEIEERQRAEEAVKQSLMLIGRAKREWESTVDSLPQIFCLIDNRGLILRANRAVERWNIGQVVDVKGKKIHELFHPNCTDPSCYLEKFWMQAWEGLRHGFSAECEMEDRVMGRYLHIQVQPISPQKYSEDERTTSYAGILVYDITDRKRAEKEISALEAQLRQAQKMEAIGRLAGGMAHDFNNLLTPIVGYTQLAMGALSTGDPTRDDLKQIQDSAERAAKLIRQMMTFARRQPTKPQVININSIILDMDKMLRRLIGEHIELVTITAPDLRPVKVEPGQFEQVIINLVVNARDAMPNGGKIIIETSNVTLDPGYAYQHAGTAPGKYVRLTVSDTGFGMTPEVKGQIFEPFFTTKSKEGGTGLGLSTVYGIVKQSGGHILVYSEPDHGTTFKIYLPQVEEEVVALPLRDEIGYLPKGNERILLVEDEPLVRGLAARVLRDQGYTVIEAANGSEAIRHARDRTGGEIHLLLTDVVMPQMGGKELADRLRALRPGIKVLFTSGYTDIVIVHHGLLDPEIDFLEKPFSPAALSRKVREILDR